MLNVWKTLLPWVHMKQILLQTDLNGRFLFLGVFLYSLLMNYILVLYQRLTWRLHHQVIAYRNSFLNARMSKRLQLCNHYILCQVMLWNSFFFFFYFFFFFSHKSNSGCVRTFYWSGFLQACKWQSKIWKHNIKFFRLISSI